MISWNAPRSPPHLPTRSDLSGAHRPSLLRLPSPPLLYSPPLHPMLPLDRIDDNYGNLSPPMSNSDSFDYNFDCQEQFVCSLIGTHDKILLQCDISLPEDLYPDDSQEQFLSSLRGNGTHDNILLQCDISLPEDLYPDDSQEQFLSSFRGNADLNEGNNYEESNSIFNSFDLEPSNAKSSLTGNMHAKLDVSAQELHQPYGKTEFKCRIERISPIPSPTTTELNIAPNDFDKASGKCFCNGCCSEGEANNEQKFGSNFENFVTYLTNKVVDDLLQNDGDHFISEPNVALTTKHFEQLPGQKDIHGDDFAQRFPPTAKQNLPLENALVTAETEEDSNHKSCSYNGKKFNAELEQVNSSLSAEISQLKSLVEKLTCQVQDLSDKLSCQKKLSAPYVDDTAQDVLFCRTEDKKQKPYESFASISGWGATIVDQSVIVAIATDYFPSRMIPTSPAYELNQPTSGRQSTVVSAVNGKFKEVGQQFQLFGKTKSAISATGQKANSAGSSMPKNKHTFSGVSFLSNAFNKVGRAATNVGSKMKAHAKKGII